MYVYEPQEGKEKTNEEVEGRIRKERARGMGRRWIRMEGKVTGEIAFCGR